jgi:hypothetical protein
MGLVFDSLEAVTQAITDFYGIDNVERINPYELREAMELPYAVVTVGAVNIDDGVLSESDALVALESVLFLKNEQDALSCLDTLLEFSWEIDDNGVTVIAISAERFDNTFEKKAFNYGVSISITTTK